MADELIDFSCDYFELLAQPVDFNVDLSAVSQVYQSLQLQVHPDKFANADDATRSHAVRASAHLNDAYQTLKSPMRRGIYLLSLQGVDLDTETDTRMDPMFLMSQMELRESIERATTQGDDGFDVLDDVKAVLRREVSQHEAALSEYLAAKTWDKARANLRQWQFLEKLRQEVADAEVALEDQLG